MAAYAAVISLKHTINALLSSSSSILEILESAREEVESLQQVMERLDESSSRGSRSSMERVDALEGHIKDCANKLEDFLEFHQIKPKDKEEVRKEIASFGETAKKLSKDHIQELSREEEDEEEEEDANNDTDDDNDVEMVGRSKEFTNIRAHLLRKMRPVDTYVCSYLGEEGTGRTVIANGVYEDLSKCRGEYFDCWARVMVKHHQLELKQVLMSIITQIAEAEDDDDEMLNGNVSELSKYLYRALENRRYMILLADVDDTEMVDYMQRTSFPDQKNGSLVLIATASNHVAQLADTVYPCGISAGFFQESLWYFLSLFFDTVTSEIEEAGNKIIQNCRCRLIAFYKTLLLLIKTDATVEQWRKIAADEENLIFMVADEISEVTKIKAELQSFDMSDPHLSTIVECISEMIPWSDEIEISKIQIQPKRLFSKMEIMSVFGMAGIGKTALARKIFIDSSIERHFDHRVWITLGPKYKTKDILIDILHQIGLLNIDKLHTKGDDKFIDLCGKLSNKRCLIVLDNLCSKNPVLHLKYLFPDVIGTILVTTRLAKVAEFERDDDKFNMELLDAEKSWILLHQIVFGGESYPGNLEKAGRLIAEKCDGLPLLILKVAEQLLKFEISEEYWNQVASGKEKSIFKEAHNQISKMLLPSYQGLPQYLKPCFLYLGVFREKHEIRTSNLTNLWISEGFLETNSQPSEEDFVTKCLCELADRSLVMIEHTVFGSRIKRCRHHSVFWHLSNSQAMKNKFFNAMNSYGDCSIVMKENHRRLCIRHSSLLGIKDVQKSLASNTSAHSLLCVGPLHQFPIPINFDFRLLRVMDALTIRLYEFPVEVVRLFHLRYLGLTCNGKLPTSISNLWKLEYLLVKRYMNIKSSQNSSLLPVEIWEMKELKHLEVMGGYLPNHKSGPGLLKLTTLLDAGVECCRKKVLKWIPNLKRLGIRIELTPGDEGNHSFRCLNRISRLRRLESLKCVVVNPHLRSAPPPVPRSMFPRGLKKLSLSGMAYPWEYMPIIGRLENLQVLKLKQYAFVGPIWETEDTIPFTKLKFLLMEDLNLVVWKFDSRSGMMLEHLFIKHCYKLKELPFVYPIGTRTIVEIVDCSSLTMAWAKQMEYHVHKISISSTVDIKLRTTYSE